ncbi:MAG: hypothetical protein ACP5UA_07835 [Candidatus Hydrogenedens sp.]
MADEKPPEQQEQKKSSSSLIKLLLIGGASVLIPAISAIVVFMFVLRPMLLTDDTEGKDTPATVDTTDAIPATAVIVKFDETQATVITQKSDAPAPLLIYQVAMSCSGPEVSAVIEGKKEYFTALINKIHRNRSRTELNDPGVQEALLRQTKNEANQLLNKLSPGIQGSILEVMYIKYTIVDL